MSAASPTIPDSKIHNIRDTALWIAGYRAEESAKPNALFRDPYAALLAGERGLAIARDFEQARMMRFAMVVRTVAIDRLVEMVVAKGANTIINVGAGLDTRPYRMNLPRDLKWIEVDFPSTIEYKKEKLRDAIPNCHLEYIAADFNNEEERRALFEKLGTFSSNASAVTEGVIGYLTAEEARQLSGDIHSTPGIQHWIIDYGRGNFLRQFRKKLSKNLTQSPLIFPVLEPLPFFEEDGWKLEEDLHILDEADRIGLKLPLTPTWQLLSYLMPGKIRKIGNGTYGYAMFGK
jgi:methyltransferase (TIGR00027 family)